MARIEYRDDGVYLLGREIKSGDVLERKDGEAWVRKRINVHQDDGKWTSNFSVATWIGEEPPADKDSYVVLGEDRELRWPKEPDASTQ